MPEKQEKSTVAIPFDIHFYCESDSLKTYYCGATAGVAYAHKDENSYDLMQTVLSRYSNKFCDKIKEVTRFQFTFGDRTNSHISSYSDGKKKTYVIWLGNSAIPCCKILSSKKSLFKIGKDEEAKIPSLMYEFTLDSLCYINEKDIFLEIINNYLIECTKEEHKQFLDDRKMFTCSYDQTEPFTNPFCHSYFKDITSTNKEGTSTCEFIIFGQSMKYIIDRIKLVQKKEIEKEDLVVE